MNIRQLKQFVAIAQSGNISRSAKDQNISQPALTRSLKNLESDLGVELIERRSNGVFLTPYGEHLLDYAHCIVSDSERVRREIGAMKLGRRGQINIGVGPAFSSSVLSSSIDRLLSYGSQLEVRLVEGFVEDLCADLQAGSLDVVLSLFPNNYDYSAFSFTGLCEVDSVLVANSRHKLASQKAVSMYQLAKCDWVIADQKYALSLFRQYLSRAEIPATVNHVRVSSIGLIKSMVLNSDYMSILPKALIEDELKAGELVMIDGPAKPLVSVGGVVCRSTGFRSAATRDFMQIVEEEFRGDSNSDFATKAAVRSLF